MPRRAAVLISTLSAAALLTGCASSSKDIGAAYVSPLQYAGFTCDQIREEQARVTTRAMQLAGQVDDNATGDAVAMGVGVLLFWPALFFIDGDGPEANEYARLKGEREALDQAAIRKNCGFPVSDPPEIAAEDEPVTTIMDADDPR